MDNNNNKSFVPLGSR